LSQDTYIVIIVRKTGKDGHNVDVLSSGNAAKLYCLNWIRQYISEKNEEVKILDLGCGAGLNFVKLLKSHNSVTYVGVDPSKEACNRAQENLEGLNARIFNSPGYDIYDKLKEKFDIVVSFSVLEHVYKRVDYLASAKECLKDGGYFLINYDAGHFLYGKERLITAIGQFLARFGVEKYYQSLVKESDFLKMIQEIGFKIFDAKFFNTSLKDTYKVIPESHKADYMNRWLEFELWLNNLGINYDDSQARFFGTRNFILTHE
jgi:SAM-dependent methyltransferase